MSPSGEVLKERHNAGDPIVHSGTRSCRIGQDPYNYQNYYDPADDLPYQVMPLPARLKDSSLRQCPT